MSKKLLVATALVISSTAVMANDLPENYDNKSLCMYGDHLYQIGSVVPVGDRFIKCNVPDTNGYKSDIKVAYWIEAK
jgi:hypothetical protein